MGGGDGGGDEGSPEEEHGPGASEQRLRHGWIPHGAGCGAGGREPLGEAYQRKTPKMSMLLMPSMTNTSPGRPGAHGMLAGPRRQAAAGLPGYGTNSQRNTRLAWGIYPELPAT